MSESQAKPYPLRMPEDLREQITAMAKANNRSLNTEIILLLRRALNLQVVKTHGAIDLDAIAQELSSRASGGHEPVVMNFDELTDAIASKVVGKLKDR